MVTDSGAAAAPATVGGDARTDGLPRVTPVLPGWLTIREIATLAGVAVATIRAYHYDRSARTPMPAPRSKAGSTPLWAVDDVVAWLATRDFSRTEIRVEEDGTLQVVSASDYLQRKRKGTVGRAYATRPDEP